jgi:phenylpropionate dioxygenase-like ring-hydroxylating dioxygenase large terminal subunit
LINKIPKKLKNIDKLIAGYKSGYTLEQDFYLSQSIFDLEFEKIWKKYWLFAGTIADIPNSGDFFTYKVGADSIIIIKGADDEVFAHYNTCRHRGSLICLEESGNAPKLLCPYHQWVYNKDGSLFKARLMPDDFDKSNYGLKPVQLRIVEGFIFISLAESPPDFSIVEQDFKVFLAPFQLKKAKVAYKKSYTLRTNWKLVAENFRECYHCGIAHPEYCSAVVGANLKEDTAEILQEKQKIWQEKDLAINDVAFVGDSFHFAVRYPLRPGVESYSTDGKAVALPMGSHTDYDAGVLGLVTYPNFWMDAVADYMWTMRVTAVSPSETKIDLTWLVNGDAVEGKDFEMERLTEFWKITGEQDWALCENNFAGIESSKYEPGPYAPAEIDVVKFIDWVIDRIKK